MKGNSHEWNKTYLFIYLFAIFDASMILGTHWNIESGLNMRVKNYKEQKKHAIFLKEETPVCGFCSEVGGLHSKYEAQSSSPNTGK